MRATAKWVLAFALCLSASMAACEEAASTDVEATEATAEPPRAPVRVAVTENAYGRRLVALDREATPLLWCYGVEDPADLPTYKEAGFNTLWVTLPWTGKAEAEIPALDPLIQAATENDLWLILALQTVRQDRTEPPRVTPRDAKYRKQCAAWIRALVERYVDTPNLIAWATPDDPGAVITNDDSGFQEYLASRYPTVQHLSEAWRNQVDDWRQITVAQTPLLDDYAPPYFARPSLDLILYRWTEFRDTHNLWAKAIRELDRDRLLFTGRIRDYKGLASVPTTYDCVIPDLGAGTVETDPLTQNAHGIDIARRAGTFCVFPCLTLGERREGEEAQTAAAKQLAGWMRQAALHGAAGIALTGWKVLKEGEGLRRAVGETWQALQESGLLSLKPTPTTAILYEPTGEGLVNNGRPLYGYGERYSPNEPNYLIYSLHRGMRHGQLDYLGIDSLTEVDLGRYGVILAPQALTVPAGAQMALRRYVSDGGVLVADLGFAMAEAGNTVQDLPEPMQELLGNYGLQRIMEGQRNMSILVDHPLFPSLHRGQVTTGNAGGMAFAGPLGRSRPWRNAISFGMVFPGTRGAGGPGSCALTINRFGQGHAVYAPFRLWANWLMIHDLWAPFHDDLFGRLANVSLRNTGNSLVHRSLQVTALREAVVVGNGGRRSQVAVVDTVGANNYVMTDCLATLFSSSFPVPALQLGHNYLRLGATPLRKHVQLERPRIQRLHLSVPAGEMKVCRMVPIRVEPDRESCVAELVSYGEQGIRLRLYSQGSRVQSERNGTLKVLPRNPSRMRVVVYSGAYPLPAKSEHLVSVRELNGRETRPSRLSAADDPPMLVVETKVRAAELTIRPAQ